MKFSFAVALLFFIMVVSCKNQTTNSISQAQEKLGRYLFYDNQLSYNQTKSCATCHDPKFAFTDSYKKSTGIYGDNLQRNSRPLFNLAKQTYFTAADSTIHSLETQMQNPLFNQHPPELGLFGKEAEIIARLQKNKNYIKLFEAAFPKTDKPINFINIKKSIAAFVRTISSYNSRYDKFINGTNNSLNDDEKAGMQLFFSSKTNCSKCHGGENFDRPAVINNEGKASFYFNTGIYNIDGRGSYPNEDIGLMQLTHQQKDMGKFKVPTLRNLEFTVPYYHDGSESSLQNIIAYYNQGGRNIITGLNKGEGSKNLYKDTLIKELHLTNKEQRQLLLFLYTLTDSAMLKNPKWNAPSNVIND